MYIHPGDPEWELVRTSVCFYSSRRVCLSLEQFFRILVNSGVTTPEGRGVLKATGKNPIFIAIQAHGMPKEHLHRQVHQLTMVGGFRKSRTQDNRIKLAGDRQRDRSVNLCRRVSRPRSKIAPGVHPAAVALAAPKTLGRTMDGLPMIRKG